MSAALVLAPFAAFVVVTASAAALVGALLSRLTASPRRASSTTLHALALFAPWLLAVLAGLALATPDPFAPCHCAQHGLHHPHLCLSHPTFASPLVAPSIIVVGVWLLLVAPRLFRLAREVVASMLWAQTIRRSPIRHEDSIAYRLHDCGAPIAFTVGAWSPVIVFDEALWALLSEGERRAVLHHEQGHVERRDGLTLLALRLCRALSPVPLGARLLDAWRSAAEKACDLHAATELGDPAAVADALVSVEKIRGAISSTNPLHALGVVAGAELEGRVLALLDAPPNPSEPRLGNDVLAALLMTLGAAALTVVWPGDTLHHAAETLFGLLVP